MKKRLQLIHLYKILEKTQKIPVSGKGRKLGAATNQFKKFLQNTRFVVVFPSSTHVFPRKTFMVINFT